MHASPRSTFKGTPTGHRIQPLAEYFGSFPVSNRIPQGRGMDALALESTRGLCW